MKLKKQHIDTIKSQFSEMKSKKDLVALINEVNQMLYGDNFKPLLFSKFSYYCNPKFSQKRYTSFTIPKKNGDERKIHAPVNGLKNILRPLNIVLNTIGEPHFKATGFVPGKSIVDNAKQHVGKNYVFNTDLRNFFHSFDRSWVKYGFMIEPFGLGKEKEDLAFLLASLCTHPFEIDGETKTVLPMGAPTSPTITNILCVKLDRRLNGLAKRFKITYSRYADDITFSSQTNVFNKPEFIKELNRIITGQNFSVNESKVRLQKNGFKQEVTGLTVNDKVNVNRRYIKQLRNWLYLWERYGKNKASEKFRKDYNNREKGRGYAKKETADFTEALRGKLNFLKMVKGKDDGTYRKLKKRFDKLNTKEWIEKILEIWEEKSLEQALSAYNTTQGQNKVDKARNKKYKDYKVILNL